MKQMLQFSRGLWEASEGRIITREFVLEIDTDKIPVAPLHKARGNKRKSSTTLSGAVIICPKSERK